MTIPSVGSTTAATLMAAIDDIRRFPSYLVGYLRLGERVRQSGSTPASLADLKAGSSAARHILVEAAWAAVKTPGPRHAFYQRIRVNPELTGLGTLIGQRAVR